MVPSRTARRLLILSACLIASDTLAAGRVLPPTPAGVEIRQDVSFLEKGRAEKLDLYLPAKRPEGTRFPAVVMIHGGGWVGGDKAAAREFNTGTTLAQAGYVCVSVNYQLEAGKRWPTNLYDCKNAVRYLRANAAELSVDPAHIGVIGGSAGGHLALMVGYTGDSPDLSPKTPYPGVSDKVNCVVDLYGITNLLTRRKTDKDGTPIGEPNEHAALFAASNKEAPELWKEASPVYHISMDSPPTLICQGTSDTTVDRDQSTELADKLKSAGVEHQLVTLPGIGHTFDLTTWRGKPLPIDLRPIVMGFFDKHLKPNSIPRD